MNFLLNFFLLIGAVSFTFNTLVVEPANNTLATFCVISNYVEIVKIIQSNIKSSPIAGNDKFAESNSQGSQIVENLANDNESIIKKELFNFYHFKDDNSHKKHSGYLNKKLCEIFSKKDFYFFVLLKSRNEGNFLYKEDDDQQEYSTSNIKFFIDDNVVNEEGVDYLFVHKTSAIDKVYYKKMGNNSNYINVNMITNFLGNKNNKNYGIDYIYTNKQEKHFKEIKQVKVVKNLSRVMHGNLSHHIKSSQIANPNLPTSKNTACVSDDFNIDHDGSAIQTNLIFNKGGDTDYTNKDGNAVKLNEIRSLEPIEECTENEVSEITIKSNVDVVTAQIAINRNIDYTFHEDLKSGQIASSETGKNLEAVSGMNYVNSDNNENTIITPTNTDISDINACNLVNIEDGNTINISGTRGDRAVEQNVTPQYFIFIVVLIVATALISFYIKKKLAIAKCIKNKSA